MGSRHDRVRRFGGLLARLRRSVRGNVLVLTAFALIPMIGLVGGGIDLSRLYLVKARLQHACDAGALAGRKAMGAGTWAQASPNPPTIANQFFDGNFKADGRTSYGLTRTFTESGGRVSGVASVSVPMTVMSFFGAPTRVLTVYCAAQEQIPNTDVMFVLDNTGSMACQPDGSNCNSGSSSKIVVLKQAVKCFYEAITQLTTDGGCPAGTSTGNGINNSSQVRFGFVPYTSNVNVGRLLSTSWMANSWSYQSRQKIWTAWSNTNISCANQPANTNTTQYQAVYSGYNNSTCKVQQSTATWSYGKVTGVDVSGLKNGSSWNSSITLPIGDGFTNKTVAWPGCIEERPIVGTNGSGTAMPTAADIDTVPNAADSNSYWAPWLPGAIYYRASTSTGSGYQTATSTSTTNYYTGDNTGSGTLAASGYESCPTGAQTLQVWSTSDFDNYVDSLAVGGGTYHDIGMLWGGRLISPNGLFASSNQATPSGGQIQRNMVFMTDGDSQGTPCIYNAYGVAYYDQRQVADSNACTTVGDTTLNNQINTRLATLCTLVKNEGVNLYVISFGGTGIAADTKARLQTCATDTNHYFDATDNASLQSAFQTIAAQITQLRLVQ